MIDKIFTFYTDTIEAKSVVDPKSGETKYFIEGHIDSSKLDLVNDIVTKSCMEDISTQFKGRNIKLDLDHETLIGKTNLETQIALTKVPLGKAIKETLDKKGNHVTYQLNPTWKKFDSKGDVTMTFADVWSNIENNMYDAFSIAYVPVQTSNEVIDGKNARLLDKVNLINVALTGNPINPDAGMTNVMTKSLAYLKSKEDTNVKFIKKSFEKDGAHAHTKESPLGEHAHPEIEIVLNREIEWLNDRINYVHDRIDEINNPKENNDEVIIGKNKNGETMTPEEIKKKAEEEANDTGDDNAGTDPQTDKTEGKAFDAKLVEVKSMLEKTNEQIAILVKSNKALEDKNAEFEKMFAKALPAGMGAEDPSKKDAKAKAEAKALKTAGPLDMI